MDIGRKPSLTRMVQRVIESRPPDESFGTNYITAEINHRYGDRLRRPVKPKLVSTVLRRLAATGRLREVRPGRPHHERCIRGVRVWCNRTSVSCPDQRRVFRSPGRGELKGTHPEGTEFV
jgi:hypothetical protein